MSSDEQKNLEHTAHQNVAGESASSVATVEVAGRAGVNASSVHEISLIENLSSFLEANGNKEIDANVLQNMAAALANRTSDTSPGTLQDVTMENSYFIYRPPCISLPQCQGTTSPVSQGRSVREFEEQMSALRKENFNLKLRLYFMEESVPGYKQSNVGDSQETLKKQLIDAKVDNEMLRKELSEKQEVLKDAALAINQFEKCQQESEARSREVIEELQERIRYLEMEQDHEGELHQHTDVSEHVNALERIRELEDLLQQSEIKLADLQDQMAHHEDNLAKRDETIKEYEEKLKEVVFRNADLVQAIDLKSKNVESTEYQRLKEELQALKSELADKACMLQEAEENLQQRTQIHEQACRTIQKLMVTIKSKQDEINKLKSTSTSANNDKSGGESGTECTGLCRSFSDSEAMKTFGSGNLKLETEIQKQTIKNLKLEIKKLTANLQNLVNNELWEKNREIERLTKLINKTSDAPLLSPSSNKSVVSSELQKSFSEADYVKAVERNRLLQRKVDVLIQRLGNERNNDAMVAKLRLEVQEARSEAELAEKWRRECADVCSILSTRLEELAGFLKSLLMHKDVLGFLAADRRRAMRKAVDRSLDLSKSLNMTLSVSGLSIGDQSLAQWSNVSEILAEADTTENRTFNSHEELQALESLETLKAENNALKKELDRRRSVDVRKDRRSLPLHALENQSESEAWSEPDRKVSLARIGLEEHSDLATVQKARPNTDSESDELNHSRTSKTRTQERIVQLEQSISRKDERILEIQCHLVEADNRLKKENLRVIDMTQEIEQLRKRNEELHSDLLAIGTSEVNDSTKHDESMLLRQIDEKMRLLEQVQEERERLTVEARLAGIQISNLQIEMDELKHKHDVELALAVEQGRSKLEEMESAMEQRLNALESEHNEDLKRSWVARTCYEECKQQLTDLQRQCADAQHTIDCLGESEKEMKQSLVENEHAARALKKQLDESMMQASKAVLERTKAFNEKLQMEKRVQELLDQLQVHVSERSALQSHIKQLEGMQECLQKQIAEATATRLNGSDVSQSGYTSEDVPHAPNNNGVANSSSQRPNNSSPDLGIESDAGRISSVELSNAQRSLLKCVELTPKSSKDAIILTETDEAINSQPFNLQHQHITSTAAAPIHDCVKVEEEKAELKIKLHKTTIALKNTYEKLRIGNQKKAQVEKEIKNQILKTHDVLKNVRSNMENEL